MKRLLVFTLILIALYCLLPVSAAAEEEKSLDDVLSSLIDSLDSDKLEEELEKIWDRFGLEGDTFSGKIRSIINGDFAVNYSDVFSALGNMIFSGLKSLIPVLILVCAVALLYSFVQTLNPDFLSEGMGRVLYFACYAVILSLLLYKTFAVAKNCFDGIQGYAAQMNIVFPLIITVMTATGTTVSASVYRPAVAFLSTGITNVISFAVVPLVTFLIILSSVSGLSQTFRSGKLASFISSLIKWILGICVTIFTLFLSIQGMTAATYDGITLRVTKYAIGNSVPLVGGFLKDGMDLFLASGILIKNALGICGIILIVAGFAAPLVELIAFIFFLKLAAGIIEPFAESKMADYMSSLAKNLNYVLAAMLTVCFMYVITIVLLICAGGALI